VLSHNDFALATFQRELAELLIEILEIDTLKLTVLVSLGCNAILMKALSYLIGYSTLE